MKTAKEKERELVIKLSKEKKTCREIASILGISKSKASFWINRFEREKNLADKPRSGRPTPLSYDELTYLAGTIKSKVLEPKRTGISSKEVLQIIEHKTKRRYTLRHAQRLLHKMGFSLITPRVNHIKKDEKAQQKFREDFKKNFGRSMWDIQ